MADVVEVELTATRILILINSTKATERKANKKH